MESEFRANQPTFFDQKAYVETVSSLDASLRDKFMSGKVARATIAKLRESKGLLLLSLRTPQFASTLDLLGRFVNLKRTTSNADLTDSVSTFVQEVVEDLNKRVEEDPETRLIPAYRFAASIAENADPSLSSIATKVLVGNLDRLLDSQQLSKDEAWKLVKHAIAVGNPQQIGKLAKDAIDPKSSLLRRFPLPIDSVLNLSILGPNIYERVSRMRVILDNLSDGNSEKIMKAWNDSIGKTDNRGKGSESVYFDNLDVIFQLERRSPGITKFLVTEYRILNFARYPVDLLTNQYESREKINEPHSLLITARHDVAGTINHMKRQFDDMFTQLRGLGHGLRIAEAENSGDIFSAIGKTASKHGKISSMLLVAHGDPNFIRLGAGNEGESGHRLNKTDLATDIESMGKIKNSFTSDAAIYLISCSTGKKDGIGQMLSSLLPGVDVHSPDFVAFLKDKGIAIEVKNGKLVVKVLFGYAEGNVNTIEDILYGLRSVEGGLFTSRTGEITFYDVPTRVYRAGKLIRDYSK